MRSAWSVLLPLLLLAGCASPEALEPQDAEDGTRDEAPGAGGAPVGGTTGEAMAPGASPSVKTLEGGWMVEAGPVKLSGTPPQSFKVPAGATWVVEIVWDENPSTAELAFHVGGDADETFSGASPLRREFTDGAPTGSLTLDSAGTAAVDTRYTAYVSVFDGVPFDPEWSALPQAP